MTYTSGEELKMIDKVVWSRGEAAGQFSSQAEVAVLPSGHVSHITIEGPKGYVVLGPEELRAILAATDAADSREMALGL